MTAVMATWHCEMHGLLSTLAEKGKKSFVAGICNLLRSRSRSTTLSETEPSIPAKSTKLNRVFGADGGARLAEL